MCVTCGCSDGAQTTYIQPGQHPDEHPASAHHPHTHMLADGTVITHSHREDTPPSHRVTKMESMPAEQSLHPPIPPSPRPHHHSSAEANRLAQTHAQAHGTTLTLEQNLLAKNDLIATQNRDWLTERNITALNLVSSPGAGKTTLLVKTIAKLQAEIPVTVIEGDQETTNDAKRIAATGCATIQVNTGTGCHLEASMIQHGLETLKPPENSLVLIENVGNLVCPALFDLGETAKVAMLSVTEGEDKPIKYPHMFRASQVMVLTKIDLLPYVNFEVQRCLDYAHQVNPDLKIFQVSATSGAGLSEWYEWLISTVQTA